MYFNVYKFWTVSLHYQDIHIILKGFSSLFHGSSFLNNVPFSKKCNLSCTPPNNNWVFGWNAILKTTFPSKRLPIPPHFLQIKNYNFITRNIWFFLGINFRQAFWCQLKKNIFKKNLAANFLLFLLFFFSPLLLKMLKMHIFDQRLGCAAPKSWLKYTDTCGSSCIHKGVGKPNIGEKFQLFQELELICDLEFICKTFLF